jgi:succinyl-CoA synthetase alpha subunit
VSILINENTKVICQGITGSAGSFHTRQCVAYGTKVVAGVTPGKGGTELDGIPVFNTVFEAREATDANASMIFVPASFAANAILEASLAGIELIVCITEGIPTLDMIKVMRALVGKKVCLIGPNCPGIITPGKCKIGIMAGYIHKLGPIGVLSRSGTLTYEIVYQLTRRNIGQSSCIGIGGDQITGTNFIDLLKLFEDDPQTQATVLIGEIGGTMEEETASFIKKEIKKPVVGYVAGITAPPGKRMGHAGAIISGGCGGAKEKIETLSQAGVKMAKTPSEIYDCLVSVAPRFVD